MAKATDIVKGAASYAVVPIASALVTLFVIPVVSYLFPADEYGKINMFYTAGTIAMNVFLLGLDHSFIRFFFEPPRGMGRKTLFTLAMVVGVLADAAVLLVVCAVCASAVSTALFGETNRAVLGMLGVYVAGLIVFRLLNTMARMQGNAARYNVQSILQNLVTRASFVAIVAVSTSYVDAAAVMTVGIVALSLFFFARQRRDCIDFNWRAADGAGFKALLAFGVPCMLNTLVVTLNASVGKLILSVSGMFDAVGVLAIATTLASAFSVIPQAFATYWSPFMYEHYETDKKLIRDVHDWVMLGSLAIVAAITACEGVLFMLVGGSYGESQAYFMLLMVSPIQTLICETTGYGIMLENRPMYGTAITAVGILVNAAITAAFVPALGGMAAGVGVAVSSVFMGLARSIVGYRLYRSVNSPAKSLFCAALILLLCVANTFLYESLALRLALCAAVLAVGAVVYRPQIAGAWGALRERRLGER